MARDRIDIDAVVERELARLGKVNMTVQEFMVQAEFSSAELAGFKNALTTKRSWLYVDATKRPIAAMVGKFEG